MNASNRVFSDATEADLSESGVSEARGLRERGNLALCEARVLARYSEHDQELTKPSVVLLDWVGDDEVTVRWDTVQGRLSPEPAEQVGEDEDEIFAPKRFRGIGARAGGVMLGIVLGAAVTIGVLAVFAPHTEPQPNPARDAPVAAVADQALAISPAP